MACGGGGPSETEQLASVNAAGEMLEECAVAK